MNKKIILIIVAVLLLGGGAFFFMKKGPAAPATPGSSSTQQAAGPSSLKDLISKGIAETCTFSNEGSAGTVSVSGGKVRGDFDSTVDGKVTKSHMIVDGTTSYLWMDGQTVGYKMTFDSSASATAEGKATSQPAGSFDAGAQMNYNCKPGIVDNSLFDLPKGVNFMSFGTTLNATPGPGGASSSSQCSYCDTLTGDSKTQCRAALNCQ